MPGQSVISFVQLAGVAFPDPPSVALAAMESTVSAEQLGTDWIATFKVAVASLMHVEYSSTVAVAAQVDVSPMLQVPAPASGEGAGDVHWFTAAMHAVWTCASVVAPPSSSANTAALYPERLHNS
jgi:hypothetical protein